MPLFGLGGGLLPGCPQLGFIALRWPQDAFAPGNGVLLAGSTLSDETSTRRINYAPTINPCDSCNSRALQCRAFEEAQDRMLDGFRAFAAGATCGGCAPDVTSLKVPGPAHALSRGNLT